MPHPTAIARAAGKSFFAGDSASVAPGLSCFQGSCRLFNKRNLTVLIIPG